MHIHLDAVGGISGNMFVAALLELWPRDAAVLPQQIAQAGFANLVDIAITPKHDGVLQGTHVSVTPIAQPKSKSRRHGIFPSILSTSGKPDGERSRISATPGQYNPVKRPIP